MAKKKRFKPVEIKYEVELSYVSTFFKERDSNSCDYDDEEESNKASRARHDTTDKKVLRSNLRSNFDICFNTTNKTMGMLSDEIDSIKSDPKIQKLFELGNKISQLIMDETTLMFPDIERDVPFILDEDWGDKLVFTKQNLEYRTNIYNHMTVDQWDIEYRILDILQEMVDEGVEEWVNISSHYNCWAYYIGERPGHEYGLQGFINHRRENLELK